VARASRLGIIEGVVQAVEWVTRSYGQLDGAELDRVPQVANFNSRRTPLVESQRSIPKPIHRTLR
jgi:hypothetical protein